MTEPGGTDTIEVGDIQSTEVKGENLSPGYLYIFKEVQPYDISIGGVTSYTAQEFLAIPKSEPHSPSYDEGSLLCNVQTVASSFNTERRLWEAADRSDDISLGSAEHPTRFEITVPTDSELKEIFSTITDKNVNPNGRDSLRRLRYQLVHGTDYDKVDGGEKQRLLDAIGEFFKEKPQQS